MLSKKEATTASDVWSTATTFVDLFSGKPAWPPDSAALRSQRLQHKKIPDLNTLPVELREVLVTAFRYNPALRCNVGDMLDVLEKAFNSIPPS